MLLKIMKRREASMRLTFLARPSDVDHEIWKEILNEDANEAARALVESFQDQARN
jgi:hypothetical protein